MLNEHYKKKCECPILEEELENALRGMKYGSSPGYDGLTAF